MKLANRCVSLALVLAACTEGGRHNDVLDDGGDALDAAPLGPGVGDDAGPDVSADGGPGDVADAEPGAADAAAVSFAGALLPILVARCGGCHLKDEAGAGGLSLGVAGQLAYAAMVDRPTVGSCAGLDLVDPDSPDPGQSSLFLKLAGDTCGARMPKGMGAVPLSAEELDLFARWIAAGAPEN